ncbi:oligosaccharyl transferase subunit ost3/OST6 [Coemansia sp. RSA 1813]|nr:oligosaccharyl transferase subunit ost3/OST6 [Coemansia sp. RSA 1646]KAJ1769594.1 oligosaccharyl transferase subunit ost3/OST6 [Coemansia sp. RSA 1843]KAJ2088443.1 oligosaccharyl transferase subunit ost3/OST6 [Coemansia sp. RSA 986]KAJ2213537.1 oligosaccharyl transferase subunit ost3/OST6 [Coemansia sp. RSA 487]KAJ2568959.1 oligosaccharyl transferase subunit ost3/OST6 [Coemansia sp. RSA 1813]
MKTLGIRQGLSRLLLLVAIALFLFNGNDVSAQSVKTLQKLASKNSDGVARLDTALFLKHVVAENKDYSVVVQLTALSPLYKCTTCNTVDASLRAVSRGWKRQRASVDSALQIVFATLDMDDGEDLFRQMGLEGVPHLIIFPAAKGPHAFENPSPREMPLNARTSDPSGMATKLGELFAIQFRPDLPIDYAKYLTNASTALAGACTVYLVYRHVDLRKLSRSVWAIATIMFALLMTSGFMWNRINDPLYIGQARGGDALLFMPINNQQYGVETQIVAATYAVCALCVVALVRHVPKIPNQEQRTFVTFMFVIALIMTYSYLNSIFRLKMSGYPFRLLLP